MSGHASARCCVRSWTAIEPTQSRCAQSRDCDACRSLHARDIPLPLCLSSFVVDANDPKLFPLAQKEMQSLLAQPTLTGVPLLVLLNKNDLPSAVNPQEVVKVRRTDSFARIGRQHVVVSDSGVESESSFLFFLICYVALLT